MDDKKEIERLKALLEKAIEDIQISKNCTLCVNEKVSIELCDGEFICPECKYGCPCRECIGGSLFKWRGLADRAPGEHSPGEN